MHASFTKWMVNMTKKSSMTATYFPAFYDKPHDLKLVLNAKIVEDG